MPDSRSAGSATSAPTSAQMTTAATSPSGLPPAPRWAMTIAPMPAKLSWHSEICPANPTSGTSDRADDADGEDLGVGQQVGLGQRGGQDQPEGQRQAAEQQQALGGRRREELTGAHVAAQPPVGQHQQHDEQQDHRRGQPQPGHVRADVAAARAGSRPGSRRGSRARWRRRRSSGSDRSRPNTAAP